MAELKEIGQCFQRLVQVTPPTVVNRWVFQRAYAELRTPQS